MLAKPKVKFQNDFGKTPVGLAHLTQDQGIIGVASLLGAFVGLATFGMPAAALVLAAGLNDIFSINKRKGEEAPKEIREVQKTKELPAEAIAPAPVVMPAAEVISGTLVPRNIKFWQPPEFNLIERIAKDISNNLIVGIPGSGKGIVLSNAVRAVRQYHPGKTIVWIDPKNDPQESGYFECDGLIVFRADATQMNPIELGQWLHGCIEEFEALPGEKLLILDELVIIASILKSSNKTELDWLKRYLTGVISTGDSRGKNVWGVATNSHLDDLGIGGGIASQLTPIALVSGKNVAALEGLLRTSFIPRAASVGREVLADLMAKSEVGRCFYHGGENAWFSMPRLQNFSGIDRDSRTAINGYEPPMNRPREEVVQDLERQFKSKLVPRKREPVNCCDEPLNQAEVEEFSSSDDGSEPDENQRFTPLNLTAEQTLGMIQNLRTELNETQTIERLWQVTKGGTARWKEAHAQFKKLTESSRN